MSEKYPIPTSSLHWADGGTPYTSTDPAGKKDVGYYPGTGAGDGEIPDAEHVNWLLREIGVWKAWLEDNAVRSWESVSEGIANTDAAGEFKTYVADTGCAQPGDQKWTIEPSSGDNVAAISVDGQRVFVSINNGGAVEIYAFDLSDGSAVSGFTGATTLNYPPVQCTDGLFLYWSSSYAFQATLNVYNRDTGASVTTLNDHGTAGVAFIASDGIKLAVVAEDDKRYLHVYTIGAAGGNGWSYDGAYDIGSAADIDGLCVAGGCAYVVFNDVGDGHLTLHKVTLETHTLFSSYDVPIVGASPAASCMVSDGGLVYIGTARVEVTSGVYGAIHAVTAADPALAWSIDMGAGIDCVSLYADQRRVLAGISTSATYVYDKLTRLYVAVAAAYAVSDGDSIYGYYLTHVYRQAIGGPGRRFVHSIGTDPYRVPFYHLALPCEDR